MVANAKRASLRDRRIASAARHFIAAIEPWYDWGTIYIERMQELRFGDAGHIEAGGEGTAGYFQIQWLGVHLQVQLGRTPKAVCS